MNGNRCPGFVLLTGFALSLIPILVMVSARLTTPSDRQFMWELQVDQFYYAANARAMTRDGFHLAHANPYDPRPDPPRLYSHLFTLLAAGTSAVTRLEPLYTYFILRPVFGVLLAVSLWYFLCAVFSDPDQRRAAFLFLMVSGGLTAGIAMGQALLSGAGAAAEYVRAEEFSGDWLCTIARVYLFTPELVYHCLWFAALGAYLRGKFVWTVAAVALELYAHPFTGPELALVVTVMSLWNAALGEDRRSNVQVLLAITVLMALFGSYILWLNRDPGHRALQATWEQFQAILPLGRYLHIYGVWLPLGILGILTQVAQIRRNPAIRCLAVQSLVVFALTNHHLFAGRAIQPAHFSRGYLFTSLVLLSFTLWPRIRDRLPKGPAVRRALGIAALLVLSLDNVLYMFLGVVRAQDPPMTLQRDEALMIGRLAEMPGREFVVSDGNLGQLIPVFTHHRSLLGHWPNTPGYKHASWLLLEWLQDPAAKGALFDLYPDLSLISLPRHRLQGIPPDSWFGRTWILIHETPTVVLYQRHD